MGRFARAGGGDTLTVFLNARTRTTAKEMAADVAQIVDRVTGRPCEWDLYDGGRWMLKCYPVHPAHARAVERALHDRFGGDVSVAAPARAVAEGIVSAHDWPAVGDWYSSKVRNWRVVAITATKIEMQREDGEENMELPKAEWAHSGPREFGLKRGRVLPQTTARRLVPGPRRSR